MFAFLCKTGFNAPILLSSQSAGGPQQLQNAVSPPANQEDLRMANHYMTVVQTVYKPNEKPSFRLGKDGLKAAEPVNRLRRHLLPVARGSSSDAKTGSSSGSGSWFASSSQNKISVTFLKRSPPYSGGTAPVFHRTSLLGSIERLYCIFSFVL